RAGPPPASREWVPFPGAPAPAPDGASRGRPRKGEIGPRATKSRIGDGGGISLAVLPRDRAFGPVAAVSPTPNGRSGRWLPARCCGRRRTFLAPAACPAP